MRAWNHEPNSSVTRDALGFSFSERKTDNLSDFVMSRKSYMPAPKSCGGTRWSNPDNSFKYEQTSSLVAVRFPRQRTVDFRQGAQKSS